MRKIILIFFMLLFNLSAWSHKLDCVISLLKTEKETTTVKSEVLESLNALLQQGYLKSNNVAEFVTTENTLIQPEQTCSLFGNDCARTIKQYSSTRDHCSACCFSECYCCCAEIKGYHHSPCDPRLLAEREESCAHCIDCGITEKGCHRCYVKASTCCVPQITGMVVAGTYAGCIPCSYLLCDRGCPIKMYRREKMALKITEVSNVYGLLQALNNIKDPLENIYSELEF